MIALLGVLIGSKDFEWSSFAVTEMNNFAMLGGGLKKAAACIHCVKFLTAILGVFVLELLGG